MTCLVTLSVQPAGVGDRQRDVVGAAVGVGLVPYGLLPLAGLLPSPKFQA